MNLTEKIEMLRQLLHHAVQVHSFTSEKVLQISEQLDRLIVIQMRGKKEQSSAHG